MSNPITIPTLYRWQYEVFSHYQNNPACRICCTCSRQIGKTFLARTLCLIELLKGGYCIWISPTNKALEAIINDFELQCLPLISRINRNQKIIRLTTGGTIEFASMQNDLDPCRGRTLDLLVCDEAAFCDDLLNKWEIWQPALMVKKGKALFISTPNGYNDFFELYEKQKTEKQWKSYKFDVSHSPMGDITKLNKNDPTTKSEYKAEFIDLNSTCPFVLDLIKQQTINPIKTTQPVVIGLDIGSVRDQSVATGLDIDGNICLYECFQGDSNQLKAEIKRICKDIPTLMDSTGYGLAIFQELLLTHPNINGYNFNANSRQDICELLAEAINEKQITINNEIATEMAKFRILKGFNGRNKFAQPGTKSDDNVMSAALAWKHYKDLYKSAPKLILVTKQDMVKPPDVIIDKGGTVINGVKCNR